MYILDSVLIVPHDVWWQAKEQCTTFKTNVNILNVSFDTTND